MADLHRLDPAQLHTRLEKAGTAPPTVSALLDGRRTGADLNGRDDLVRAVNWLAANPPAPSPDVICHGDLHPFNLLVDEAGVVTVLDGSAGLLGPRSYDAAFTSLMLAEPPIGVPRVARPLLRAAGRLLARRFLRDYRADSGLTLDKRSLRWHKA